MPRAEVISGVGRYKVGTVARLTGLSTHLIRAWERRYDAVTPQRSPAGTRLYSEEDVARLQLLKALVDLGDSASAVAQLPEQALRERLARSGGAGNGVAPSGSPGRPVRVALLAPELAGQIRANPTALAGLELVLDARDPEAYRAGLEAADPDLLVLSLDALRAEPAETVSRCRGIAPRASVFVLYSFAPRRVLDTLTGRGARLAQLPIRLPLLRRLMLDTHDIRRVFALREAAEEPPAAAPLRADAAAPTRFDDGQLAALLEAHSSVECECPNHLARIVRQLLDFERYSQRCLAEQPRDADLHRLLARASGQVRRQMEDLLARVCEHDGIPIPPAGEARALPR